MSTPSTIYSLITLQQQLNTMTALLQNQVAHELGLSIKEMRILSLLFEHTTLTPKALANYLGVTPGAITTMCDRLINREYISRTFDTRDRRKVIISIDRFPDDIIEGVASQYAVRLSEILSAMNADELQAIYKYVSQQKQALDDAYENHRKQLPK